VSVAILDEDDMPAAARRGGRDLPAQQRTLVRPAGLLQHARTLEPLTRNLWFHTGDFGKLDEDGYLHFAGRSKELIRRRGENISALQVEDVLRRHPAVADAAVYAVRAEFLEDEVMASVVCKEGQLDGSD
jgi:crotonobetaine/carnitine-CoA ligase